MIENQKNERFKALERCFRSNYQALCYFASGLLHDDEASEDVVQDVFLKIAGNKHEFESEEHIKHYFYLAVRNACVSALRVQKRSIVSSWSEDTTDTIDTTQDDLDYWQERSEMINQINKAIDGLSPRNKQVFIMSFVEQMKVSDIAKSLEISTNTVKVIKQRAKAQIKKELSSKVILFVLFA